MECSSQSILAEESLGSLRQKVQKYQAVHSYESASYWADKMASISGTVEDILVSANCHYLNGHYHRAVALVKNRTDSKKNSESVRLIASCLLACKEYQSVVDIIQDFLVDPDENQENINPVRPQTPTTGTQTRRQSKTTPTTPKPFKLHVEVESSLRLLLGKAYEGLRNHVLSCQQYHKAFTLDPFCWEAFDKLVSNHHLDKDEELSLLHEVTSTVDPKSSNKCEKSEDNKDLLDFLYSLQLNKYASYDTMIIPERFKQLEDNNDVIVSIAERLYYNCSYSEALRLTTRVLENDPFHSKCMPLHIAILVEMKNKHALFCLGHKLVDTYPQSAVSWFGVACYYHVAGNHDLARQFFQKCTTMDSNFGPAWLAYGHSFAVENEHDQAMAAYMTASHVMKGCHLPFLYIGLEYGLTSTTTLAGKFFYQAKLIAPNDPFLLHDIAVIEYFNTGLFTKAHKLLEKALSCLDPLPTTIKQLTDKWEPMLNNMGHCLRKLRQYDQAIEFHQKALLLAPTRAGTLTAIGYAYMLKEEFQQAVEYLHKALSLKRNDAFITNLLATAIEELSHSSATHITDIIGDEVPDSQSYKDRAELADDFKTNLEHHNMIPKSLNPDAETSEPRGNLPPSDEDTQDDGEEMSVEMDVTMDDA